jgi:hypothetical protein
MLELNLSYNRLSGPIPGEFGSVKHLRHLDLSTNQLTGLTPPELGKLQVDLGVSLNLSVNHLTGSIPPELGNLNAVYLNLSSNLLTGPIPTELGKIKRLNYLDLSVNQLTGHIPPELGTLVRMGKLKLCGNALAGEIPKTLEAMDTPTRRVQSIDIRWNALHTVDAALGTFLESKEVDGDWSATQTVPPSDVSVSVEAPDSITLSWAPVSYTANPGYYRIYASAVSGGPYQLVATTRSKADASWLVTGLHGETLYLVIDTVTEQHVHNPGPVESDHSKEVYAQLTARMR